MSRQAKDVVRIAVDASVDLGELVRLWASIGFDELNWTYTPRGLDLLASLSELGERYLVRSHNMYTSGTAMALPHWSAGNVYHEQADGTALHDFSVLDRAYDAVVEAGHVPIVELGFTPVALVPADAADRFAFQRGSPSQYGFYEAGGWSFPPRDLTRWSELVTATAERYRRRYGAARMRSWRWEVWNEPDIGYWRGSVEEYVELYRVSVAAVRAVLPEALVGGPATTGDVTALPESGIAAEGPGFLDAFLDQCVARSLPLDFVSFHTKGAYFRPWRSYLPTGGMTSPQSPSMTKMLREIRASLRAVEARPELASTECLADECDASVPAHHGRFDNSNFAYRNSEYFPVFQCALMKKLLDLAGTETANLRAATAWAFYVEGERCFEGTRSLRTYGGLDKPVLHAYRLLSRLGERRIGATSTASWDLARLDQDPAVPEEIDVLAARSSTGVVSVLVWRHDDDQHREASGERPVRVHVRGLPPGVHHLREWRVDAGHANAFRRWEALGAPDYPDAHELAELQRAGQLVPACPDRWLRVEGDELVLDTSLRLPAVVLLELSLQEGSSSGTASEGASTIRRSAAQ